jgi:lantibiotic modifying enzyme
MSWRFFQPGSRADWARLSADIVRDQARFAARYPGPDLIFGRAGFLATGVGVAQAIGDLSLLKFLRPCAQSLWAIPARSLPSDADAGMAHGKAGIGFAHARWAEVMAQPAWLESARSLIDADLVVAEEAREKVATTVAVEGGESMISWCRGGLGVALAALRLHVPVAQKAQHLVHDAMTELANGTNAQALGLCHGLLGTLEFLEAARAAGISGVETVYDSVKGEALGRVLGGEICCDHSHRLEAPGLMKGLAGTGYELLRMLNSRDVPSILTFEPGRTGMWA